MTAGKDIGPLRKVLHRNLLVSRGRGSYWYEALECGHSIVEEPGTKDRSLSKPAKRRRCWKCGQKPEEE